MFKAQTVRKVTLHNANLILVLGNARGRSCCPLIGMPAEINRPVVKLLKNRRKPLIRAIDHFSNLDDLKFLPRRSQELTHFCSRKRTP